MVRLTKFLHDNLYFDERFTDTESQPPITLPVLKYLCIPSETIDISLIANISCPSLECITLIWQTSTDLDPEFLNESESPLFLIDRCITNRSSYPNLKELMVLMNSRQSRERYPDVQILQKLLPRCSARVVAFGFAEVTVCTHVSDNLPLLMKLAQEKDFE